MFSVINKFFAHQRISIQLLNQTLGTRKTQTQRMQKVEPNNDVCTNIVWMDMELTGLDVEKDKILEVSCLLTDKNLNIIAEGLCFCINHPESVFQQMSDWCIKQHNESGLVDKCLKSEIRNEKAEQVILDFLKEHIPKKKCPLAGNSVYMDRLFLYHHMPKVHDYLHYRIIDVSTIKELARRWQPKLFDAAPEKKYDHRSLNDIYESIEELKYYKQTFFKISS